MSRSLGIWLAVLVVLFAGKGFAHEPHRAVTIERAQEATVGILPSEEEAPREAVKSHFSVRGSGVYIGDRYLVTARHAVEHQRGGKREVSDRIRVLTSQFEELPARLIGVDAVLDVAVYRLDVDEREISLRPVNFSDKEPVSGEEILTVGYPLGWGPAMTFGRVGNTMTFLPTAQSRLLQLDMSACSGNSGGGVFDAAGNVVGLIHAVIQTESIQSDRRCSHLTFAVPGPLVRQMVTALIQGKHPPFSKLGIHMTAIKVGIHWRVAVKKATGPARAAGLRPGDIVLAIDGTEIRSAAHLKSYVLEHTRPGQRIAITIQRDARQEVVHVTLGGS
ncbi:MAG: serine protease [Nitrospirae bacterium]|nr:MAG: serine protease [Nitrospirota bacterium]